MVVNRRNDQTMSRIAIVLYSYSKRRDRQQLLCANSLSRISRRGYAQVFLTTVPGEEPPSLPGIAPMRLDSPSGYEHLPDKTIAMLRWLAQRPDWDYVIKCDDDVLLDPAAVRALTVLQSLPDYQSVATYIYGANTSNLAYHRGKCTDSVFNGRDVVPSPECEGMPFAVGHCYMLSRKAVERALEELQSGHFSLEAARAAFDVRGINEDVLLGYLLREQGIRPVESLRLLHSKPRLRGLVRHLGRELMALLGNYHGRRLCIGAITDNRLPWWGECLVLRGWFTVSGLLSRLLGRKPAVPHRDRGVADCGEMARSEATGGKRSKTPGERRRSGLQPGGYDRQHARHDHIADGLAV
jgi:hypothetical protein